MEPRDREDLPPDLDASPDVEDEDVELSSERERAAMVASVLRHEAERTEVRATIRSPSPKPLLPQLTGLAISTALAVYVWFGSPAWLEPEPVPLPPVEVEAATLRLAMFIQAQAIEHYREANGRAPAFLEEAGPPRPGVEYHRVDGQHYILHGQGDRVRLTYASRDSLGTLFGPRAERMLLGTTNP